MKHAIVLCGRRYELCYSVNSLCALEEETGKRVDQVLSAGISSVRAVLWCGLLRQCPHMTLDACGALLERALSQGETLEHIAQACASALNDACFFRGAGRPPRPSR